MIHLLITHILLSAKLLLFSLQALRCCNHSSRQQFKAADLKTRLCSVAEKKEFKGKSEDYKDLENPTENEPFNLSKKRN